MSKNYLFIGLLVVTFLFVTIFLYIDYMETGTREKCLELVSERERNETNNYFYPGWDDWQRSDELNKCLERIR